MVDLLGILPLEWKLHEDRELGVIVDICLKETSHILDVESHRPHLCAVAKL